jgi:hypothetical protein
MCLASVGVLRAEHVGRPDLGSPKAMRAYITNDSRCAKE